MSFFISFLNQESSEILLRTKNKRPEEKRRAVFVGLVNFEPYLAGAYTYYLVKWGWKHGLLANVSAKSFAEYFLSPSLSFFDIGSSKSACFLAQANLVLNFFCFLPTTKLNGGPLMDLRRKI